MKVNITSNTPKFHYEFETEDNGIVAVYGVSGSGKSSLIDALSGFNPSIQGDVIFWQENILSNRHLCKICYMPQNPILFPHWSIAQNLKFALEYTNNSTDQLHHLLTLLNCSHLLNKLPLQLSGGEKQRVSLIRTLITAESKSLILLDEPFSALDVEMRKTAIDLVQSYKHNHLIFLVSHQLSELYKISNHFLLINQNQVEHHQPTNDIMQSGINNLPIASKLLLNNKEHVIYADNVSISLVENKLSSIVYQMQSTIKSIKEDSEFVILRLQTEDQQTLYSKITKHSFNRLNLGINLKIFAHFKASNS
jgi:molybdate transport system ATP-binding protein